MILTMQSNSDIQKNLEEIYVFTGFASSHNDMTRMPLFISLTGQVDTGVKRGSKLCEYVRKNYFSMENHPCINFSALLDLI